MTAKEVTTLCVEHGLDQSDLKARARASYQEKAGQKLGFLKNSQMAKAMKAAIVTRALEATQEYSLSFQSL